jgi:hypothetical protein
MPRSCCPGMPWCRTFGAATTSSRSRSQQAFELPPRSTSWLWRSDPLASNGFGMPPVDQMQQSRLESTFASVRLRTRVTKGPGSKAAGLAMAFKLLEAAQDRWRAVNGPHLVALVRAGTRFDKGVMVERPDEDGEVAA